MRCELEKETLFTSTPLFSYCLSSSVSFVKLLFFWSLVLSIFFLFSFAFVNQDSDRTRGWQCPVGRLDGPPLWSIVKYLVNQQRCTGVGTGAHVAYHRKWFSNHYMIKGSNRCLFTTALVCGFSDCRFI